MSDETFSLIIKKVDDLGDADLFDRVISVILVAEGARPATLHEVDDNKLFTKFYSIMKKKYGNLKDIIVRNSLLIYQANSAIDIEIQNILEGEKEEIPEFGPVLTVLLGKFLGFQCAEHNIYDLRASRYYISYFVKSKKTKKNIDIYTETCERDILLVHDSLAKIDEDIKNFNSVLKKYGYLANFSITSEFKP